MQKEECYYLGRITKPFGVKGQMVLYIDADTPEDYRELDSAYVEVRERRREPVAPVSAVKRPSNTTLVPYFFHIDRMDGNKAIATFEELSLEEAHALAGCDLYLPLELLPKLTGNQFYFHEVVGFRVVDSQHGDIGVLASVIEYPAQPLFQVMQGDTEILIPLVDPVIQKVDRESRTLFIDAPNGLIELYLQS